MSKGRGGVQGGSRGVAGGFGDKFEILVIFRFELWRMLIRSCLGLVQALLFAKSGTKWRTEWRDGVVE